MAQDPYGNEVVDPFDQAIADAVMRSTWWSAVFALALALLTGCCLPGRGLAISPMMVSMPILLLGFLSIAATANVTLRVITMQPEHKVLVPGWHPWAALGLALVGAMIAALQIIGALVVLWFSGF